MKGAERKPQSPTWHHLELRVASRLKSWAVHFRADAGNEWPVPDLHE